MGKVVSQYVLEGDDGSAVRAISRLEQQVSSLEKKLKKATGAAKEGKGAHRDMGDTGAQAFTRMASQIGLVAMGVAAARQAFNLWKQDVEEFSRVAREANEPLLDLMALGTNARDPKFRQRMLDEAVKYGVQPTELARGRELLQSMTGSMTQEQREALFAQAGEHRQITSLGLGEMIPLYAKTAGIYRDLSAQQVQNVIATTIQQASTTAAEMAPQFPRVLGAGKLGKLSADEMGSLFAAMTETTGTTRQAATAMLSMTAGMMAPSGAEGEALAAQLGFAPDENLRQRFARLQAGYRSGTISDAQVEKLVGREALTGTLGLLRGTQWETHLGVFRETEGRDIVAEKRADFQRQPWYRLHIRERVARAKKAVAAASDARARGVDVASQELEGETRAARASGFTRLLQQGRYYLETFLGADPEATAAGIAGEYTARKRGARVGPSYGAYLLEESAGKLNQAAGNLADRANSANRTPMGPGAD